jgi:hypothetical protein
MKQKRIENTSNHDVTLIHEDGLRQVLNPGHATVNVKVVNLDEIRHDVTVTHDLSEVVNH